MRFFVAFGPPRTGGLLRMTLREAFPATGNVLNSQRAVQMSVFVVRAFVRLRQVIVTHKDLEANLKELERKFASQDGQIRTLFQAIRQLMAPPDKKRRGIGFLVKEKAAKY